MASLGDPFGPYPPGGPSPQNFADGQCQMTLSGSSVLLARFGGRYLWIGNEAREIPIAGVLLDAAGLSSATVYYVYARWDGRISLEASTTAYETDGLTGHLVKYKDRARRLVGMVRTNGSSAFVDSASQRFVRSWFNSPRKALFNAFSGSRSTTSTSYAELNSEIRCEFLVFSGEIVDVSVDGGSTNSGSTQVNYTSIGFDGIAAENVCSRADNTAPATVSVRAVKSALSEGYHYATVLGKVSAGTGTWYGGASTGENTTLKGAILR